MTGPYKVLRIGTVSPSTMVAGNPGVFCLSFVMITLLFLKLKKNVVLVRLTFSSLLAPTVDLIYLSAPNQFIIQAHNLSKLSLMFFGLFEHTLGSPNIMF